MVNKIKTIGILTVLMLLTLCFIFLPDFISNQNENTLMNNKTNWNYTPDNNTEISSVQVIRLYQSRNFDCDFIYSTDESFDKSIIVEEAIQLFKTVFESDEYLGEYMDKILSDGNLTCFQKKVLTVMDNHPVALNLIKVIVATPNGSLEFMFENKTKTLLSLSYYLSSSLDNYKTGTESFANDLNSALAVYCKNRLELSIGEYNTEYTIYDQNYSDITFSIMIPGMEFEKN